MNGRIGFVMRWLPRLAALVVAGGFLTFLAGEFFYPHSGPPQRFIEWLGIALVTLGCLAPLLAWKWELEGALLSLASLSAFFVLVHLRHPAVVGVMGIPALLFLADWALRKTLERPGERRGQWVRDMKVEITLPGGPPSSPRNGR